MMNLLHLCFDHHSEFDLDIVFDRLCFAKNCALKKLSLKTFTFMHLADAFIQSIPIHCISRYTSTFLSVLALAPNAGGERVNRGKCI